MPRKLCYLSCVWIPNTEFWSLQSTREKLWFLSDLPKVQLLDSKWNLRCRRSLDRQIFSIRIILSEPKSWRPPVSKCAGAKHHFHNEVTVVSLPTTSSCMVCCLTGKKKKKKKYPSGYSCHFLHRTEHCI